MVGRHPLGIRGGEIGTIHLRPQEEKELSRVEGEVFLENRECKGPEAG